MSSQSLWLTHFIEILLFPEFQLKIFIVDAFSYQAHFRPQISSNGSQDASSQQTKGFISSILGLGGECHGYALRFVGNFFGGAIGALARIMLHKH